MKPINSYTLGIRPISAMIATSFYNTRTSVYTAEDHATNRCSHINRKFMLMNWLQGQTMSITI
jgi:hypothetical protein